MSGYIGTGEYYPNKSESTLPYEFEQGSAVVYNNKIHILGGYSFTRNTKHYSWNGSSWAEESTLPYEFESSSAVVYNNKIHILGSGRGGAKTNHYSWNGSSWVSESTLPYDFSGRAVVYNGKIHTFYGTSHYSWNGSSWVSESTLPFGSGIPVVYNNKIHLLGGWGTETNHYSWNGSSWFSESTLPYALSVSGAAIVYKNKIHILGGPQISVYQGEDIDYTTNHFSYNGTTWIQESDLPYKFRDEPASAVIYNDRIHILGGIFYGGTKHYSLEKKIYRDVKKIKRAWFPVKTGYKIDTETTGKPVLTFENKSVKKAWIGDDNGVPRLVLNSHGYEEQPNGVLPSTPIPFKSIVLADNNDKINYFNIESEDYSGSISWYIYNGSKWVDNGLIYDSAIDDFANRFLAVLYNNTIYFFGGAYYYELANHSLNRIGSLPNDLTYSRRGGVVVSENKVHILSGTNHYSWDGTTWSRVSTIPFEFTNGSVVSKNIYYIYVCGNGYFYGIDRRDMVWRQINNPPNISDFNQMVVDTDNHIHLFAEKLNISSNHYVFVGDGPAGSWISEQTYPFSYDNVRGLALLYRDKIHIFGGKSAYSEDLSNFIYDEDAINDWTANYVDPIYSPKWLFFKGKLYIFPGGNSYYAQKDEGSDEFLMITNSFYMDSDPIIYEDPVDPEKEVINVWADGYHYYTHDGLNWIRALGEETIPSDLGAVKAVSNDGVHFFYSVRVEGVIEQTHYKYSDGSYTLVESSLPIGNSFLKDAFSINNKIYLLGHTDPLGDNTSFIPDLYSWDGLRWTKEEDFPVSIGYNSSSLTVSDDKLYVISKGKWDPDSISNKLYVYDGTSWKERKIDGLSFSDKSNQYSWPMTTLDNQNLLLLHNDKNLYEVNIMNYFT